MLERPIRLGLVGVGKIARDQHIPAIAKSASFDLAATASRNASLDGVPAFTSLEAMLDGDPALVAVALCQPPQVRFDDARRALLAGKHVFLEKPPGATVSEVELLCDIARDLGVTLFASWHSRHSPAVEPARAWLAQRAITQVTITWKEDFRVWHPGQDWIWAPGGFGVFDPGINGLSIATHILPSPVFLTAATLEYPANQAAPITAGLALRSADGTPITADFSFRQTGEQSWDIAVETDDGRLELRAGGSTLTIDGALQECPAEAEYPGLYARFAALIAARASDVDLRPLKIVADAFLLAHRTTSEPITI